jgi:hypothetical protein
VHHHHVGRLAKTHTAHPGLGKRPLKGDGLRLIQAASKSFERDGPHADPSAGQAKSGVDK